MNPSMGLIPLALHTSHEKVAWLLAAAGNDFADGHEKGRGFVVLKLRMADMEDTYNF